MGSRRVYRREHIETDYGFPDEDWHDLEHAHPTPPPPPPQYPQYAQYQYVETPLSVALPVPPAPSSLTPYAFDDEQRDEPAPRLSPNASSPIRMPWEVTTFRLRLERRARLVTIASVAGSALVVAASVFVMLTAGAAHERERAANAALPTMALPNMVVAQPPTETAPLASSPRSFADAGVVAPPASVVAPPASVVAPRPRPPRASAPVPPPAAPARPKPRPAAPSVANGTNRANAASGNAGDDAAKKALDEARHETDDALN